MVSNNWGLVGQPRWLSPCQSIEFEGCPWQRFLVLRTAPENDYGQRLPHCALVEIIFWLEEVATVYRAWSSGASACRNPSKPEFCFKNLAFFFVFFSFSMYWARVFTAAIFHHAHGCATLFEIILQSSLDMFCFAPFAHSWSPSVSHTKPVKEVAQLPLLSCTCPVQGNDIEVSTTSVLTDRVGPKVFLGNATSMSPT